MMTEGCKYINESVDDTLIKVYLWFVTDKYVVVSLHHAMSEKFIETKDALAHEQWTYIARNW